MLVISISIAAHCSDKNTNHYTNKYIILCQFQKYLDDNLQKLTAIADRCNTIERESCDQVKKSLFEGSIPHTIENEHLAQYAALHHKFIHPIMPLMGISRCTLMSPGTKKSTIIACKERTPLIKRLNRTAQIEYYCHTDLQQIIAAIAAKVERKKTRCEVKIVNLLTSAEKALFLQRIDKTLRLFDDQKKYDVTCMIMRRKKGLIQTHNQFLRNRPPIKLDQRETITVNEDLYEVSCGDEQINDLVDFQNKQGITRIDITNATHIQSALEQMQAGHFFAESSVNNRRFEVIQNFLNQKGLQGYHAGLSTPYESLHATLTQLNSLLKLNQEQA